MDKPGDIAAGGGGGRGGDDLSKYCKIVKSGELNTYFTKTKTLGKGAFGEVSSAKPTKAGEILLKTKLKSGESMPSIVAIKEITRSTSDSNDQMLLNEISILSRIVCPAMVRYYGCFVNKVKIYIVMEKFGDVDGIDFVSSLDDDFDDGLDRLDHLRSRLMIARQMAVGIYQMHKGGVIHRDIKLENILVDSETQKIKFIDVGLSCMADSMHLKDRAVGVGCDHRIAGTPRYMDPFLLSSGWKSTIKHYIMSDWYSYGHALYILLTDCNHDSKIKDFSSRLIKFRLLTDEFTPLTNIVYALLNKNPVNRSKLMGTENPNRWAKIIVNLIDEALINIDNSTVSAIKMSARMADPGKLKAID